MRRVVTIAWLAFALSCGKEANNNPCSGEECADAATTPNNASNIDDPTCVTPCPTGEVQEFGACDHDSCVTRMACGEEVVCRDQAQCLAVSSCSDGGLLLDACPPDQPGCLPYEICGVRKYCITLQQCARDACDAGESATTLACDDPAITQSCREQAACGTEIVSCVCRAADLFCDADEMFDTNPCVAGQICREVLGCGRTFYCKGASI